MPNVEKRDRLKLPHVPIRKRPSQERLADFCEVSLTYTPEEARAEASRCVECATPPCVRACPLHNPIKDWLVLAAEGKFLEAAHLSRTTSNMPEICGRICPQDRLCEDACIVGVKHPPVAIGAIEKFINDHAVLEEGLPLPEVAPSTGQRIAVVGSGPSGLACAEELVRRGHHVTVYEASPRPGGLLRYGIPGFKLAKSVVDRRTEYLARLGVEFVCGTRVGIDVALKELLDGGFAAAYLATGATVPKRPSLPGVHLDGIEDALPFLIRNNPDEGEPEDDLTGARVVVLGGGDTAMDCLRTARRLGAASVTCVYRRDEANMPGSRREVQAARDEGVVFEWLKAPVRFLDNGAGGVRAIDVIHMQLGEPDKDGRRKPVAVEGSNFETDADLVILAFGFDGSPVPSSNGPQVTTWGTYTVNGDGMTSIPGVFAGGDAVRGADLVTTALVDGRAAAAGIDRYLRTWSATRTSRTWPSA